MFPGLIKVMNLKKTLPILGPLLLSACATSADLPEEVRRPNAARILQLDKVNPGDAFVRHIMAQFEPDLKCELPLVKVEATRIDFLIYQGAQVSSVSLSNHDVLTTSSEITIESGREPLVLRLGNHLAHIWRVKGAVDRIRKIYLASNSRDSNGLPLTAVVGVPNAKIVASNFNIVYFLFFHAIF